jgi:hypothetical protein
MSTPRLEVAWKRSSRLFVTGKRRAGPGRQFIYTAAEVQRLLVGAGLGIVDVFGGLDGKPFALGADILYVIAEKSR